MINKFTKKVVLEANALTIKEKNFNSLKSIIESNSNDDFATALLEYFGQDMSQKDVRKRIDDLLNVMNHTRSREAADEIQDEITDLEGLLSDEDEEDKQLCSCDKYPTKFNEEGKPICSNCGERTWLAR